MKRTIAFFTTLALCAFVAWLGGYDFNERNPAVAGGALFALWFAFIVAAYPGFDDE